MSDSPHDLISAGEITSALWADAKEQARRLRMNRGWKGPFAISFDERLTYDPRRVTGEQNRRGRFCHVLVHNASPLAVPGCTGTLRAISKRTADGRYVPVPEYRRRLQLRWANVGNFEPVTIEGNDMARLDLCYTVEGSRDFRLEVPDGLGVQTMCGPGIYRVTIRASAPGAIPTDEGFLIVHDGRWKSIVLKQGDGLLTADEIARVGDAETRYRHEPAEDVSTSGDPSLRIIVPGWEGKATATEVGSKGMLESNSAQSPKGQPERE